MRDDDARIREDNAAKLIRAAFAVEARLDPRLKEELRLRLAKELRPRRDEAFPKSALLLLAGAAGMMGLGALYDMAILGLSLADLPEPLMAALVLNLAAVPPALFIRAKQRRKPDA
jgi:hypothetical protein